jgi:hypothetical protein
MNVGLEEQSVGALAIDPANPLTLYAGTLFSLFGPGYGSVFRSVNGGGSWSDIGAGLGGDIPSFNVPALAMDPVQTDRLYAALDGGDVPGIFERHATEPPLPPPVCGAAPFVGCRVPAVGEKAQLQMKNNARDEKDLLVWKWTSGSLTIKEEFGRPLTTTSYRLCVYDGTPSLILDAVIPAAGTCGAKRPRPCWRETGSGYGYGDSDLTPDGIKTLVLKEGAQGKAEISLKGKGPLLDDVTIPIMASPVRAQLTNGETCWEAVYSAPFLKNTATPSPEFKDKADP